MVRVRRERAYGVVINALSTGVEQRAGEVRVGHRHRIIECPQRGSEAVRNTTEPTARRRIRLQYTTPSPTQVSHPAFFVWWRRREGGAHLEHDEGLAGSHGDVVRRVEVRRDDRLARRMVQIIREHDLRVDDRSARVVHRGAVVRRVTTQTHTHTFKRGKSHSG